MIFSSISFIVFFSVVLLGVCLLKGKENKQKFLLLVSYVFYGWWDYRFCFLMLALTAVSYVTAIKIERNRHTSVKAKRFLRLGIVFPLVILGFFKYFNFFVDTFISVFDISSFHALQIILPVGISFYTFQSMSYTIDVYRGKLRATDSFLKLALYISFFPQLVAGPIVRAIDFLPQLEKEQYVTWQNFKIGFQIFLFGMIKKVCIADYLAVFVDDVYRSPVAFDSATVWLAIVAYSIQIYFDFSGYTDMAVGCARCLGYTLCENFNLPYLSKSVSEFWKRWHISLSTWLMEYLYFPLGGNRKGRTRTYINLIVTMALGGLWHGASWNFVLWGILHGVALCINKMFRSMFSFNNKLFNFCSWLITFIFVSLCWVLFRAGTLTTAVEVFNKLFVWTDIGISQMYVYAWISIAVLLAVSLLAVYRHSCQSFYPVSELNTFYSKIILWIEIFFILGFGYVGSNPFIYFQF